MIKSKSGKLAFLGIAILVGVGFSWGPWQAYFKQRSEADKANQIATEARAQRAELVRKKALGESTLGRETNARKKGFGEPGEVSVGDRP